MHPRSCKAKGRKLQNLIRDRLTGIFKHWQDGDCRCAIMGESGCDLKLSPAARQDFPYSIESKNVEKLNVWTALQQAQDNAEPGTDPVLVFSRNRSPVYAAISFDLFLKLTGGDR